MLKQLKLFRSSKDHPTWPRRRSNVPNKGDVENFIRATAKGAVHWSGKNGKKLGKKLNLDCVKAAINKRSKICPEATSRP